MDDTSLTDRDPRPVDFWFDPSCPWAWITSRWLVEVAPMRSLAVRWRLMSLTILNEDRTDLDERWHRDLARRMDAVRVCAAVEHQHGPDALGRFYTELGASVHGRSAPLDASTYAAALDAAGLDPTAAGAATSTRFDQQVRASHVAAVSRVGPDVGTPVIAVGDVAFFGPVLSPAPRGPAAVELWDAVTTLAGAPGFFELKRSRSGAPLMS